MWCFHLAILAIQTANKSANTITTALAISVKHWRKLYEILKIVLRVAIFHPMTIATKVITLCSHRGFLSSHGSATSLDPLTKTKHDCIFLIFWTAKQYSLSTTWQWSFYHRDNRESQSNWFGKRGISWHISVVFRRSDEQLQWQGFVHVIQSCSQDSLSVIAIKQDVLRSIKAEYPDVRRAYFRQDNAGCCHSSATILACPVISQCTGVQITRVDFSDPQGG